MNPITKALSDIHHRIPRKVLEEAFVSRRGLNNLGWRSPVSVDYRIREEVIDSRVIPDCNLVGGTETTIPLGNVTPQYLPEYKTVYRIPLSVTNNRKISRIYHIMHGSAAAPGLGHGMAYDGNDLLGVAQGLLATHQAIPNVSNAHVQLIGENTILVHDQMPSSPSLYAQVMLESDSEFSHLSKASIPAFSKLVEYAVKSYIFNALVLEIDEGFLSGGRDLGRFREIVDGYADAEELYQTFFDERWRKIMLMSDPEARSRHLRMTVGGQH